MAQGGTLQGYKTRVFSATGGKTRDKPISDKLRNVLNAAADTAGVTVRVTSGGQAAKGSGGRRTGSVRHDLGNAADLQLVQNGRTLDFTKPADRQVFETFVAAATANGATGIGAGIGYMGAHTIHVGFGTPATWGAGGRAANAPGWLVSAVNLGRTNPSAIPQSGPTPPADISPVGSTTLRKGSKGPRVVALQQVLAKGGHYDGPIDGDYGPQTKAAVEAFQRDQNRVRAAAGVPPIKVDGRAGPQTLPLVDAARAQQQYGPLGQQYAANDFGTGVPKPPTSVSDIASGRVTNPSGRPGYGMQDVRPRPNPAGSPIPLKVTAQADPSPTAETTVGLRSVAPGLDTANLLGASRARAAMPPREEPGLTFEDRAANARQNQLARRYQPPTPEPTAEERAKDELRQGLRQIQASRPPIPRANPLDFSGAMGQEQRRVLEEAAKRDLTSKLIGMDPRNPPVDAGTGGGVFGDPAAAALGGAPLNFAPEMFAPSSSSAPLKQALDSAAAQKQTRIQNAIGNEMAGAWAPQKQGLPPLPSTDVPKLTVAGLTPAQQAQADRYKGLAAKYGAPPTYQPTSPMAASPAPPQGTNVGKLGPQPGVVKPQQGPLAALWQNPLLRGGLGLLTGGPIGAAMGLGSALIAQQGGLSGLFQGNRTGPPPGATVTAQGRDPSGRDYTRTRDSRGVERISSGGKTYRENRGRGSFPGGAASYW